jgi:hypothetical protein
LPVPDPLVVLQQPPDTFVKVGAPVGGADGRVEHSVVRTHTHTHTHTHTQVGARDHHFVVEVGLPRSARGRLKRLRTGIALVVELRCVGL